MSRASSQNGRRYEFFLKILTGKLIGDHRFKVRDKITFHSVTILSYIRCGTLARGIRKQDSEANVWA